jgi:hypothetical protein
MTRVSKSVTLLSITVLLSSFLFVGVASTASANKKTMTVKMSLTTGVGYTRDNCVNGVTFVPDIGIQPWGTGQGARISIRVDGRTVAMGRLDRVDTLPNPIRRYSSMFPVMCVLKTTIKKVPLAPFYTVYIDDDRFAEFTQAEMRNLRLTYL